MAADSRRVKELFGAAIELQAADRSAYLDRECRDDAELRQRLDALLKAHDAPASALEQPLATGEFTPDLNATLPPAPLTEQAGERIGPYKLLQKLGEGGMGAVWVAEQTEPVKRRVALKLIKPGMDSELVLRRFDAERQALALMDHTNIAKVLDASTTPAGRPYFAMELVKGVPITRYCDELHLPIRDRLTLFIQVCQAIQHAHQKGVIHRDIKPSNVLVAVQDGNPVPKVIDFGVAKALNQRLTDQSMYTEIGAVVGTLEYMSPEQAELSALDIDTRADVYALGVLLYELLTGTTPLDRRTLKTAAYIEMLRMIKEDEPPKPSTRLTASKDSLASLAAQRRTEPARLTREVRGDLDWIVMKCLDKDRTRRYETANAIARDVERHLADEPVEAGRPSAGYRLRKFARKYKLAITASTAFVLLLAAGVVVSTWQAVRASRANAVAEVALAQAEDEKQNAEESRAKAEENEANAERSAEESKKVLAFLRENVLKAVRPANDGGLGLNVTVRDALNAAEPKIEETFVEQPEIELAIRSELADTFSFLADHERAVTQHERIVELVDHLYDAVADWDHYDRTLEARIRLATAYKLAQRYDQAIEFFEAVLPLLTDRSGADGQDTLACKGAFGICLTDAGQFDRALPILEEVVPKLRSKVGLDEANTRECVEGLTLLYFKTDRSVRAVPLLEEVLAYQKAKYGPDNFVTLRLTGHMGLAYSGVGRDADAARMEEEALRGIRKWFDDRHPNTVNCMYNLATCYQQLQRYADAEGLLASSLDTRQKTQPDDWVTFLTMSDLGNIMRLQKKYAEAEPHLLKGLAGMRERWDKAPAHLKKSLPKMIERLVLLYDAWNKPEEAAKWRAELDAIKK
jgi:eukaryotic-like serine/threonine-protein kinase